MYVTVSLKIELKATAHLSEMESQIQEAGRAAQDMSGVRKSANEHARDETASLADVFRTNRSSAETTALPRVWAAVSASQEVFSASERAQYHS